MDCNKFIIQLGKEKQAILLVFQTVSEATRGYQFVKKAQENQREIYKMRKNEIKTNIDFCILYSNNLEGLENSFKQIVSQLFTKASQVSPKDTTPNQMRKFSMLFNSYMIGFNAKSNLEPRYLALYLKIFQNFYFEKVIDKVIKNKMKNSDVILNLINDMKFHEEYLNKWKISDLRINMAIKSLENIFMKLYFNQNCVEISQLFDKLKLTTYYYYIDEKKISYIIADGFNLLKGHLISIKNIRKDSEFKVNVLTYLKRGLLLFLLNLEFLSQDLEIKLEVEKFPPLINAFIEINTKFEQLIKIISDNFKINHKYLFYFFPKNHYRNWFSKISENFNRLYQLLMTRDITEYFLNLKSIDGFVISDYFETFIIKKLELASQFLPQYNTLVESAVLDSTINCLFEYLSHNFKSEKDFEYEVFKVKLAEMQSKIINLKTNDSLTKTRILKIIRSFNDFFTSSNNIDYNLYNISFGFAFKKNFDEVNGIINIRHFTNNTLRERIKVNLSNSNQLYKDFQIDSQKKNKLYFKIRILKFINKFAMKLKYLYENEYGAPNNNDDAISQATQAPNDQVEQVKKPPDVDDLKLDCRYFCYKKPAKQNYAYIKYKYTKKNKSSSIRHKANIFQRWSACY